jgi:putative ABC transport system substrate-binding protein
MRFRELMQVRALLVAAVLASCVALLAGCGDSGTAKSSIERVRRVGLMHVGLDHVPPSLVPLATQLKQEGWDVPLTEVKMCAAELRASCDFKGKNIDLIWRNLADGQAANRQAQEFVRNHVDLIVAFEDQSIQGAKSATSKTRTPVVFLHPFDPVKAGYVRSLAHPGGNLTGVFGLRDLVQKQLELYTLLVPGLHRVLLLIDPHDPSTPFLFAQTVLAAQKLHLQLTQRLVTTAAGLKQVFGSLHRGEVDGVFVVSPKILFDFTSLLIQLAKRAHLPVQANRKEWVEQGAFFSYGPDFQLIGRHGARYVDSILKGAKPSQLAVEYIPQVKLAINLAVARALRIRVPQSMVIRADYLYR